LTPKTGYSIGQPLVLAGESVAMIRSLIPKYAEADVVN